MSDSCGTTIGCCGIFCQSCFYFKEGTCLGCSSEITNQHACSKWSCEIRKCCKTDKSLGFCFECNEFPCQSLLNFQDQFKQDDPTGKCCLSIQNMTEIKVMGISNWLLQQEKQWKCKSCGKKVNPYLDYCEDCSPENKYGKIT